MVSCWFVEVTIGDSIAGDERADHAAGRGSLGKLESQRMHPDTCLS